MLMATKRGRMMTSLEWPLPIKSHDHIITWSCKITWQTKIITNPLTQRLWLSSLAGGIIQWGVSFQEVTRSFDHVVLQGHVNYFSCCITTTTRPVTAKLGTKWWLTMQNFNHLSQTTFLTSDHVRSRKVTW